ncbi:MAG: hypothetical protein HY820_04755 [Acidobacteria bacterium]|nr:hypothetical protein [Acidobacteriota bacterium]
MEQEPIVPNNPQSEGPPGGEAATPGTAPPVTAYCRACGKGLTSSEVRPHGDTVYCEAHVPGTRQAAGSTTVPPVPPAASSASPGLAFLLGLIPGVGAIYNGQFAKAVVHLLITALVFSMAEHESGTQPLFGMLAPVWVFYMALEAAHTAKKKQLGEPLDEFSSIFPGRGVGFGFPILPVLLIVLGVVFLLDNLQLLHIQRLIPYAGPLFLIALGGYMLYARLKPANGGEVSHERN